MSATPTNRDFFLLFFLAILVANLHAVYKMDEFIAETKNFVNIFKAVTLSINVNNPPDTNWIAHSKTTKDKYDESILPHQSKYLTEQYAKNLELAYLVLNFLENYKFDGKPRSAVGCFLQKNLKLIFLVFSR
jgi:hypothetical protein